VSRRLQVTQEPRKFALGLLLCVTAAAAHASDCVVLLHGLARTARSMNLMQDALAASGYRVANVDYPSRHQPIEQLAAPSVEVGVERCALRAGERVHFVTHSMGGILVRYYLAHHAIPALGRVVMLAPPNGGSEVVDNLEEFPGFELLNGPAGLQLGTGPEHLPEQLGAVDYPVGIIAGTRSVNPVLSQFLPNPDDGKVSLQRTKVEGMTDFIAVEASHPFIMRDQEAIAQTIAFLQSGRFIHDSP
jgi:triacylglycerol lipase